MRAPRAPSEWNSNADPVNQRKAAGIATARTDCMRVQKFPIGVYAPHSKGGHQRTIPTRYPQVEVWEDSGESSTPRTRSARTTMIRSGRHPRAARSWTTRHATGVSTVVATLKGRSDRARAGRAFEYWRKSTKRVGDASPRASKENGSPRNSWSSGPLPRRDRRIQLIASGAAACSFWSRS